MTLLQTIRHALRWYPNLAKDILLTKLTPGSAYRPNDFWEKRHASEHTFWTVGRRAFDEPGNRAWYGRLEQDLRAAIAADGLDLSQSSVLEIGAGIGFWTKMVRSLGCQQYVGVEIAQSAVDWLSQQFPVYRFEQADASKRLPEGPFDVVMMIHVDEHIHGATFDAAQRNIRAALKPAGTFYTTYQERFVQSGVHYVEYHTRGDFERTWPTSWVRELPRPNNGDPLLSISARHAQGGVDE